jgi:hypothetical protein
LNYTGGLFTNAVGPLPTLVNSVTVSSLASTDPTATQSAGFPASVAFPLGSLFRLNDPNPRSAGDTMTTTLTFSSPTDIAIVASATNSNFSSGDQYIEFTAFAVNLAGFSWNISAQVNIASFSVSGLNNETIRIFPGSTTSPTPFGGFTLDPTLAIDGFTVVSSATAETAGGLNSVQFAVDAPAIPEPTTAASLAAVGIAFTLFRFRRRSVLLS